MNDKNKIKSEIERLLNKEWKWGSSIEAKFRCEAYRELLEFIDSLPEESASEDLEEAAIEYCHEIEERNLSTLLKIEKGFIKGAQWKEQQIMKGVIIKNEIMVATKQGTKKWLTLRNGIRYLVTDKFKAGDKVKVTIVKED